MRFDPRGGARSLIDAAIGAKAWDTLAIVAEDPHLGINDAAVPGVIADVADEMGIAVRMVPVGDHAELDDLPEGVVAALTDCDHVFFHARLGETLRFCEISDCASKTMSYALDIGIPGGLSCTVPHRVMERIRAAYDFHADRAQTRRTICSPGTDLSGTQDVKKVSEGEADDFTATRYPVRAPRPMPCATASGIVAVVYWLMASGNRERPNDEVMLPEPVNAFVEMGRSWISRGRGLWSIKFARITSGWASFSTLIRSTCIRGTQA